MESECWNALGLPSLIAGHSRKWKLGISFVVRPEKRNTVVNFRCFVLRSRVGSFHFRSQATPRHWSELMTEKKEKKKGKKLKISRNGRAWKRRDDR